ncbi:MAG: C40 family peptidase, partial [Lachnospiraceae bacterium]|nr:C40 family peptidase [Lachnospiraceae bacterium]
VEERLSTAITMSELLYGEGVSDVRVDICQYAKQFVGNPYVWGGTSLTRGADCSGFVLSLYAKYGITLPHSSAAQANCGRRVALSQMKPGDLVFYTKGGSINHVAMYIGNGQVIHASSPSTGIRISSVNYRTPYVAVSLFD